MHRYDIRKRQAKDEDVKKKQAGFSLVELLITVALMGIIFAIAALSMTSMSRTAKLNETRDQLLADIEDVKLKSIAGTPRAVFVLGGADSSYSLRALPANDANLQKDPADAASIITLSTVTLPANMKVDLNGAVDGTSNSTELWFDRKGVPRTNLWGILGRTLTVWYDADNDNVLDPGEPSKTITLSNAGRVKYEY